MNLQPHPTGAAGLAAISAEARRLPDGSLALRYELVGNMDALLLPSPGPSVREDGLWRHSCCEAFLRVAGEPAYTELNFSPSGAWAAYRFTRYREGMQPLELSASPSLQWQLNTGQLTLSATVPLALPPNVSVTLALAAVVEGADGALGWWALRHPPGAPDFHHCDGFVVTLPPVT